MNHLMWGVDDATGCNVLVIIGDEDLKRDYCIYASKKLKTKNNSQWYEKFLQTHLKFKK